MTDDLSIQEGVADPQQLGDTPLRIRPYPVPSPHVFGTSDQLAHHTEPAVPTLIHPASRQASASSHRFIVLKGRKRISPMALPLPGARSE